jgi:metal-responsive CopG/Arc/MetJ family transcriptional regulator
MDKTDSSYNVDNNMKLSYIVCGEMRMIRKTVAMDEDLVRELDIFAKKEHRDFSSALRYTLRIGLLAVENPELTVQEIKDILEAIVDYEMGNVSDLDLKDL